MHHEIIVDKFAIRIAVFEKRFDEFEVDQSILTQTKPLKIVRKWPIYKVINDPVLDRIGVDIFAQVS